MRRIVLDIANIETVEAMHIYLQYRLGFPAHYGRNLDALHDMLTDVWEDLTIVVRAEGIRGENALYLPRLLRVLEEAAQENVHLTIET